MLQNGRLSDLKIVVSSPDPEANAAALKLFSATADAANNSSVCLKSSA